MMSMKKKTWSEILLILMIDLILVSFFPTTNAVTNETEWRNITDKPHTFVYQIKLREIEPSEALSEWEYVKDDMLGPISIKVLHFPINVSSISMDLILRSKEGREIYRKDNITFTNTNQEFIDLSAFIRLNESGIWSLEIGFKINPLAPFNQSEIISVWEYSGSKDKLCYSSKLLKIIETGLPAAFSITKRLTVYTVTDYALIRSARASEITAKTNKDLIVWQKGAFSAMIISAIATAFMAFWTFLSIRETKKERKRDSIKQIIAKAIKEGIHQFKYFERNINKIKRGSIDPLPRFIAPLTRSYLRDFRLECPRIFEKIYQFLEDLKNYDQRCDDILSKIRNKLSDEWRKIYGLDTFINELMKEDKINGSIDSFFDEELLSPLAESIALQEYRGDSKYSKKVWDNFKKELLEIRKKEEISKKLTEISDLVEKMEKYLSLSAKLKREKEKLMKKYNIYNYEIEGIEKEHPIQTFSPEGGMIY